MLDDTKLTVSTTTLNVAILILNLILSAATLASNFYLGTINTKNTDDREYVQMAVTILAQPKGSGGLEESELRNWAVSLLDEKSPVPFNNVLKLGLFSGEYTFPTTSTVWVFPSSTSLEGNSLFKSRDRTNE